ncbi:MAG: hypothetical protein Q9215_001753 [Flavoplaca cf. flavocitrina]
MARSDEAQWWFNAVYEAVQEIPPGSVTSYGHIALLLGRRDGSHRGPGGAARQAAALRQEGVTVGTTAMGEFTVDFSTFGWFPTRLPSEVDGTNDAGDE